MQPQEPAIICGYEQPGSLDTASVLKRARLLEVLYWRGVFSNPFGGVGRFARKRVKNVLGRWYVVLILLLPLVWQVYQWTAFSNFANGRTSRFLAGDKDRSLRSGTPEVWYVTSILETHTYFIPMIGFVGLALLAFRKKDAGILGHLHPTQTHPLTAMGQINGILGGLFCLWVAASLGWAICQHACYYGVTPRLVCYDLEEPYGLIITQLFLSSFFSAFLWGLPAMAALRLISRVRNPRLIVAFAAGMTLPATIVWAFLDWNNSLWGFISWVSYRLLTNFCYWDFHNYVPPLAALILHPLNLLVIDEALNPASDWKPKERQSFLWNPVRRFLALRFFPRLRPK